MASVSDPNLGRPSPRPPSPPVQRRLLRDSPVLILLGIGIFLAALVGLLRVADRSTELAADYLSEVVLYALSAAELVTPDVAAGLLGSIDVYRVISSGDETGRVTIEPLLEVAMPTGLEGYSRAAAERLAQRAAAGVGDVRQVEPFAGGAEVVRAAALIGGGQDDAPVGVVVASDALTGSVAFHSRRVSGAYEAYSQLRVLQQPLAGVYLSFFVMLTLMILISATWLGVYVAKRITRPVHLLAAGAREIGAGHFDYRIEPQSTDEFGSLVDAFNTMAGELSTSRRRLERSRRDLERTNREVDQRREYIETILERIATGVVSMDAEGRLSRLPCRLC